MLSLDKDGDLLMSDGGAGSSTMGWSILRTRARQEKIVARELAAADVRHYLPLVTETRSLGGHDIIVSAPLLPGHVFVHGPVEDVSPERIIEQVEVSDQDGLNWELKNLSAALTYDVVPTPCEPVANGAKVRVASGPLRGLEGRIEATDDAAMLILQVTALQRAVRVSLDGAAVDPLQSHKRSTVGQESA